MKNNTNGKQSYEGLEPYKVGYQQGYSDGFQYAKDLILEWANKFIKLYEITLTEKDNE